MAFLVSPSFFPNFFHIHELLCFRVSREKNINFVPSEAKKKRLASIFKWLVSWWHTFRCSGVNNRSTQFAATLLFPSEFVVLNFRTFQLDQRVYKLFCNCFQSPTFGFSQLQSSLRLIFNWQFNCLNAKTARTYIYVFFISFISLYAGWNASRVFTGGFSNKTEKCAATRRFLECHFAKTTKAPGTLWRKNHRMIWRLHD